MRGEGRGECNLDQFWFYYAPHTRGPWIWIKNSFKIRHHSPKLELSWPRYLISLFKWKVGDWLNQTNDLYQPIVIIFPEFGSCSSHIARVTGWWLTKCQLKISFCSPAIYLLQDTNTFFFPGLVTISSAKLCNDIGSSNESETLKTFADMWTQTAIVCVQSSLVYCVL